MRGAIEVPKNSPMTTRVLTAGEHVDGVTAFMARFEVNSDYFGLSLPYRFPLLYKESSMIFD
jgi:hypothetical protein